MNMQQIDFAQTQHGQTRTVGRDPLQVPISLDVGKERIVPSAGEILRSVVLWLLTFAVALSGALLVGNMPELKAAMHPHVSAESARTVDGARNNATSRR